MEPLVSVVMPTYNSSKYIRQAIDSIINQTFSNWELLVMDGHSKDGTVEIIKEYETKDDRIKLVLDEGKGIGAALNQGCKLAKGKYIARMDADDISMPERFEKEINFLRKNEQYSAVSCASIHIDENGDEMGRVFPYTLQRLVKKHPSCILHPGIMMVKAKCMEAGCYPPIKRAEDLMLWLRMMRDGKIAIIQEHLVRYRVFPDSLTSHLTPYFTNNVHNIWLRYVDCDMSDERVIQEINEIIEENIVHEFVPSAKSKYFDSKVYNMLAMVLPSGVASKMVFFIKNIYGLL